MAVGIGFGVAAPDFLRRTFGMVPQGAGGGGGMMGSATSADMSLYMDMFNRHSQIRRKVEQVPTGIRTTTESDDPGLTAQLHAHVSSMYEHVDQGQEVTCMSNSLPVLFNNAKGYQRQLTFTSRGVTVTETSSDCAGFRVPHRYHFSNNRRRT